MAAIQASWTQDPFLQQLIQSLEKGEQHPKYLWQQANTATIS